MRLIILFLILLFPLGGCKGKGGSSQSSPLPIGGEQGQPGQGNSTGSDGSPDPNQSENESQSPYQAPVIPTREELALLVQNIPEGEMWGFGRILHDEILGSIPHEEAARQRICYLFDHECLNDGYKDSPETRPQLPCQKPFYDFVQYEISQDPELKEFFKDVRSSASGGGGSVQSLISHPSSPPKSIIKTIENVIIIEGGREVEMISPPNTTFSFKVFSEDLFLEEMKAIDRKKTVSTCAGAIDVYYHSSREQYINTVQSTLTNSKLCQTARNFFGRVPPLKALLGETNPKVFLHKDSGMSGWFIHDRDGAGYVHIHVPDQNIVSSFVRGEVTYTPDDWVKFVLAHEMGHFFTGGHHQRFLKRFDQEEGLATSFSHQTNGGQAGHFFYGEFLRQNRLSSGGGQGYLRPSDSYEGSLFWDYLQCRSGSEPVQKYHECLIRGGKEDHECFFDILQIGGNSIAKTLREAAETFLNLPTPPSGVTNMRDCDPHYQDFYLPVASPRKPIPLPDTGPSLTMRGTETVTKVRSVRRPGLMEMAYDVYVARGGDTFNNYFKFDLSWCNHPDQSCSIFGFKVGEDNRTQYDLLFYYQTPPFEFEYFATEPNKEPDVVVVVTGFGLGSRGLLEGEFTLESKTNSQPIQFEINWATNDGHGVLWACDPDDASVSWRGTLDGSDIPTVESRVEEESSSLYNSGDFVSKWNFGSTDEAASRLNGVVPFDRGTVTYSKHWRCTSGFCPQRRELIINDTTLPVDGDAMDVAWLTIDSPVLFEPGPGTYNFNVNFHIDNFEEDYPVTRTCVGGACCGPGGGRQTRETRWESIPLSIAAFGAFEDGISELRLSNPDRPEVSGRFTFSEPWEVPRSWLWMRHYQEFERGGLVYGRIENRWGRLAGQLVPPIIDFQSESRNEGEDEE